MIQQETIHDFFKTNYGDMDTPEARVLKSVLTEVIGKWEVYKEYVADQTIVTPASNPKFKTKWVIPARPENVWESTDHILLRKDGSGVCILKDGKVGNEVAANTIKAATERYKMWKIIDCPYRYFVHGDTPDFGTKPKSHDFVLDMARMDKHNNLEFRLKGTGTWKPNAEVNFAWATPERVEGWLESGCWKEIQEDGSECES